MESCTCNCCRLLWKQYLPNRCANRPFGFSSQTSHLFSGSWFQLLLSCKMASCIVLVRTWFVCCHCRTKRWLCPLLFYRSSQSLGWPAKEWKYWCDTEAPEEEDIPCGWEAITSSIFFSSAENPFFQIQHSVLYNENVEIPNDAKITRNWVASGSNHLETRYIIAIILSISGTSQAWMFSASSCWSEHGARTGLCHK